MSQPESGPPLEALESASRQVSVRERRPRRNGGPVAYVHGLRCRECGREYEAAPIFTCEWCFGPLEVAYDYDAITKSVSREKIAAGPASLWRYSYLLAVEVDTAVDLRTRLTPLLRADRLAVQ